MALVGRASLSSLESVQFVRCIPSTAKPVFCPSGASASGRITHVRLVCHSSHEAPSFLHVGNFAPTENLRVRRVSKRMHMPNKIRAHEDAGTRDYATGPESAAGGTPVLDGVAENRGESSSPLAVAIRNVGLSVKSEKGEVPVLKDCSLNVPEGQLWMLLGPNGCGKSTLLKAMAGLLKPNRGKMFVIGPRSFVFQNPDHQVVMPTAEADVAFGLGRLELSTDEVRERVHKSLQAVGMDQYAQRPVQTLSGGQKQRIAIAGALAESSRLLLLDELTTYLDRGDQIGVLEAVRQVVGVTQKVTALWVTHRLEELEYADGAAYMENGRVVLSGSVADVEAYIKRKQEEFYTQPQSFR